MHSAQKSSPGGELIPLRSAKEQYWSGRGNVASAGIVCRRFLNGSIVRFAVSGEHSDYYWDTFFQTFRPMIEIGGMMFDVDIHPLDPSDVNSPVLCAERSYRVVVPFFARLLFVLGFRPSGFSFTYSVSTPNPFVGAAWETSRRTYKVLVLLVERYRIR